MGLMKLMALELEEMSTEQLQKRLVELEDKEDSIHEGSFIKSILHARDAYWKRMQDE